METREREREEKESIIPALSLETIVLTILFAVKTLVDLDSCLLEKIIEIPPHFLYIYFISSFSFWVDPDTSSIKEIIISIFLTLN